MGVAGMRTTNPLLLGLVLAVVAYVVAARRTPAPWSRSFVVFLRLGVMVVVIRLVFQILFGARMPGTTLFTLPSIPLPSWAGGVSLGGEVTLEALVTAFYQGLRMAVLLACFGAASSLASPHRLLRSLPAALYETGVAVTVAMTFAPQAVATSGEIRDARRLRGRPTRGPSAWRGLAMPVLEGALERSIALAASMDSRGYGRRGGVTSLNRRLSSIFLTVGLMFICVGLYLMFDGSQSSRLGLPVVAMGSLLLAGSMFVRGRHSARTRYRPDPWVSPEWIVSVAGGLVIALMSVAGAWGADLNPSTNPVVVPGLPLMAVVAIAIGLLPAFATPLPPTLSDVSMVDAPVVDAPGVDAPVVDAPVVDAPGVDAPVVEVPVVAATSDLESQKPVSA